MDRKSDFVKWARERADALAILPAFARLDRELLVRAIARNLAAAGNGWVPPQIDATAPVVDVRKSTIDRERIVAEVAAKPAWHTVLHSLGEDDQGRSR